MCMRRIAAVVLLLAAAACGTEHSAAPGTGDAASSSPSAQPPSPSYACGQGPPRHSALVSIGGNGEKLWRLELAPPVESSGQVAPVVSSGTIYAVSGGTVTAVDAASGQRRWSKKLGDDGYGLWIAGDDVVASFDQVSTHATITALRAGDGHRLWSYR